MAEEVSISCPECHAYLKAAAEAVGHKIRCKGCDHVFVAELAAVRKIVGKPAGKAAGQPSVGMAADAKKKAADVKAADDDDEDDSKPYGVTSVDTAPRCPECANEMESEEAIICLVCGYNTQTRMRSETRAVEDVTGMMVFLWLLPGILCVLTLLFLLTFDIWYSLAIRSLVQDAWYEFIGYPWFVIWLVWAPTVPMMVAAVAFAVRRLILHPRPPERVKKKAKQEDD